MTTKPAPPKAQTFAASLKGARFFTTSLMIHLIIVSTLGSLVLFKASQGPETFTVGGNAGGSFLQEEEAAVADTPLDDIEFEEPAAAKVTDTPASQSTISSMMPSSTWSVPASAGQFTVGSSLASLNTSLGSASAGQSGTGGRRMGTVFGMNVESAKLGVVFDVSFSTHEAIDSALAEIEKSFPDAMVVLAPGCGMEDQVKGKRVRGKILEGAEYRKNIKKFQYDKCRFYMGAFLPALLQKNKKFEAMWDKAGRQKRMYVLHLDQPTKETEKMINGTQLAIKFAVEQGVDTIWWMADFKDPIDKEIIEKLGRELQKDGIKVMQHDFDGGDELRSPPKNSLADLTGGKVIVSKTKAKAKK